MRRCRLRGVEGSEGAVLPVASFGLLLVSLLVASALLTASSELVLSRAYQHGLLSLHAADGALESFVSGPLIPALSGAKAEPAPTVTSFDGKPFELAITLLRLGDIEEDSTGVVSRRELFSIVATPADGRGRISGTLVETLRRTPPFQTNLDAALTAVGSVEVDDGALLAATQDETSTCAFSRSILGLRISADGMVGGAGSAAITGEVEQDSLAAAALLEASLGGVTFSTLSEGAEHYFGSGFGKPPFDTFYGPRFDASQEAYRWGCPDSLVFACPEEAAAKAPVVVIDAGSSEVELNGGHGSGVLIIRGGGARIAGDFRFAGLVLIEGNLRLTGTAQIHGAAVVGGDAELGDPSTPTDAVAVVFDACSVRVAERALTIARLGTAPQTLDSPTFGWYEVVR